MMMLSTLCSGFVRRRLPAGCCDKIEVDRTFVSRLESLGEVGEAAG